MGSQYNKRKAKEAKNAAPAAEETAKIQQQVDAVVAEGPKHVTYDAYYDPADRKYKSVTLEYNPVSGEAKVLKVGTISRQVALVHENNQYALKKLIKK